MLAPDNVQVPAFCLVRVPDVVPKTLARVPPCAPPNVNPSPDPVIVPTLLIVIVPVPPTIELADPKVNNPA